MECGNNRDVMWHPCSDAGQLRGGSGKGFLDYRDILAGRTNSFGWFWLSLGDSMGGASLGRSQWPAAGQSML